ncbi:MAG: MBL fold metallo-hydrolase [Verrucomicrobiales bacterium]|nr:MBL fold metallo-hydrolase [Verrucomicrobiales bacterium]
MFNRAEITFLGTGTSIGVPVIGCDCKVCNSDDPKNQRLRSSILLRTHEVALVVDTGPDFRQQCLREGIRGLDAVIFTHGHSDHVMGFDDLRRFTVLEDEQIRIFGNRETMQRLEKAYPYVFDGENRYRGYLKVDPNLIEGNFRVGDLEVTPLPVSHGKVETLGFLFSSRGQRLFAYIPDAKELAGETRDLIRDLDLLILDGLQPKPHWTHLSIPEAIEIAQELEVAQTWLTHFSCLVDYSAIEPGLPDGIGLAWDGMKIVL